MNSNLSQIFGCRFFLTWITTFKYVFYLSAYKYWDENFV